VLSGERVARLTPARPSLVLGQLLVVLAHRLFDVVEALALCALALLAALRALAGNRVACAPKRLLRVGLAATAL
jgi:hypothetical protein